MMEVDGGQDGVRKELLDVLSEVKTRVQLRTRIEDDDCRRKDPQHICSESTYDEGGGRVAQAAMRHLSAIHGKGKVYWQFYWLVRPSSAQTLCCF